MAVIIHHYYLDALIGEGKQTAINCPRIMFMLRAPGSYKYPKNLSVTFHFIKIFLN